MNMNAVKETLKILSTLARLDDYVWHEKPSVTRGVMILLLEQCLDEIRGSEQTASEKQ